MISLLLIEDDLALQEELSTFMLDFFDTVHTVTSAEESLDWLEDETIPLPDMVITDICLPQMSGLDFLRYFRKQYPNIMAVIISAYPETEYLLDSIELKIEHFFVKPFDSQKLITKMFELTTTLRKNKAQHEPLSSLHVNKTTWIDLKGMSLYVEGEFVYPGKKEQQLLELLITNRHQHIDEQTIAHTLWPERAVPGSTFRALMRRLREKLGSSDAIQNVRGYGYKLNFIPSSEE